MTDPTTDFRTSTCGGDGTNGYGCGNHTTRWIGFANNSTPVSYMLVVIGDDDVQGADGDGDVGTAGAGAILSCDNSGSATFIQRCQGGQEFISFAHGTVLVTGDVALAISVMQLSAQPATTLLIPIIILLLLLLSTLALYIWRRQRA